MNNKTRPATRRTFVKQAAGGALAALTAPAIAPANKTGGGPTIVGEGNHRYEANHRWAKLVRHYSWQTTHDVAIDSQGYVYVIHEGRFDWKGHPSIFVFDPDGTFVRAFGHQFQGGGHGLEVRREGSEDFVYVAAYQQPRSFAKLTTKGELVWRKFAPMESRLYAEGEDQPPVIANPWGRDRFHPTNFAFHPDGGFYLADGYGSFRVHRYDADGKWLSMFGAPSDTTKADGTFDTPHGIWIDSRRSEPLILIGDRANKRLQWFTLGGEHVRTLDGFLLPANIDVRGDVLLIPDLVGRVTLLDADNQVLVHLGDDSQRITAENGNFKIREDESKWTAGKFVHPHDACFDAEGNIYVTEWVRTGRVTKLTKQS